MLVLSSANSISKTSPITVAGDDYQMAMDSLSQDDQSRNLFERILTVYANNETRPATCRLDSGADLNFISAEKANEWNIRVQRLQPRDQEDLFLLGNGFRDGSPRISHIASFCRLDWCVKGSRTWISSIFFLLENASYDMILGVADLIKHHQHFTELPKLFLGGGFVNPRKSENSGKRIFLTLVF